MNTESTKLEGKLEFLLLSSFNLSNLAVLLSNDCQEPLINAATAPFGQVMQALLRPSEDVWSPNLRGAVVWTAPQSISAGYRRLVEFEDVPPEELLRDVDQFCEALKGIPSQVRQVFIPTWILDPLEARAGLLDMHLQRGLSTALMRMNLRLVEALENEPRMIVLDASRWAAVLGAKTFSNRLWYMSKTPYTTEFFKLAAGEIKAAVAALRGSARKLLLVDLDDTLWGGIVGDVGWQNLRLGGHDPIGEAFVDFQSELKRLKKRGILLGIVSKNEEGTALEAIGSHAEMVLRANDFVGWRINWQDKAQNIAELVSDLSLGLQSVVFIDDNPAERARIQQALPDVLVPDWPQNPLDYKRALAQLRCFDSPFLSAEDRGRTELYVSDRKRREARVQLASVEEWLASLEMRVSVEELSLDSLERATQLLNKTNQMNLSTRRLSKDELWAWSQQSGNTLFVFRVSDKFGDYGLVGLGGLSLIGGSGGQARVVDFVLSCRVMGRQVEEAMLNALIERARAEGAKVLTAAYRPTAKNQPCLAWLERSGMERLNEPTVFAWHTDQPYANSSNLELRLADAKELL